MKKENEIINNEELIRIAYSKQIKIHITLTNGSWRNGFVTKVLPDFFYFKDVQNDEEPFFYIQLIDVQPFKERGRE